MKYYITLFVIALFTQNCCSNQFLRNLDASTLKPTKVVTNCISTEADDKTVKLEGEVEGTITAIETADAKDMGITFTPASGTAATSTCTLSTEGELTCTLNPVPAAAATYTIEAEEDFELKKDETSSEVTEKLLAFKLENAVSFTTEATILGVDATQTDKEKAVNYDEAKEEDLAFSVKFDADLTADALPKIKANSKELTCTVDATDAKIAKCTFTKEQLPLKDDKTTKYEVTFVNACSTETKTGVTVTVSNSAFVTFKVALMFLGLFLL